MERKLFGHRLRKKSDNERVPGEPFNDNAYDRGDEEEDDYNYVKEKDFPNNKEMSLEGRNRDMPSGYEGREHIKYRDPGHSPHNIKYPQDEPHMKSHVNREEEHEAEDDYHMGLPDQTKYELEKKLKRAHMKMDTPEEIEEPARLRGNITHNVPYEGEEDTSGEEKMGTNLMQSAMPKAHRKKMIAAVVRRKMKKEHSY